MKYTPASLDTSSVELSDELKELSEAMAKNVHEVWARSRYAQGWTWGPERSDSIKTHPCLIPYEDLPECEKDFDRFTSAETLKFIMEMGFEIKRK